MFPTFPHQRLRHLSIARHIVDMVVQHADGNVNTLIASER